MKKRVVVGSFRNAGEEGFNHAEARRGLVWGAGLGSFCWEATEVVKHDEALQAVGGSADPERCGETMFFPAAQALV